MSFLRDKIAEKIGDMVKDKVMGALGVEDDKDEKDKDDSGGGFRSWFGGDKDDKDDDDDRRGGPFSYRGGKDRDKDDDDDKGNFFSRLVNRDDDDDDEERVSKRRGFEGLFSEQDPAMMSEGGPPEGGVPGDHMTEGDLDLMSDLMEVAKDGQQH